jgi:hypothetical protein
MVPLKRNKIVTHKQVHLFVWIVVLSLGACNSNKKKESITNVVLEWIGKEIRFPEHVSCYVLGKDTFPELCLECFQKEYKILLYVDSAGCSNCRLNLFEWKQLIEESDTLFQGKLEFLLFFQPKNIVDMTILFMRNNFDHPVFIDTNGSIDLINHFPQIMEHQCFLLNSDNKVLVIGNPALNSKIWELYKSHIDKNKQTSLKDITTLSVEKIVHDFGIIPKGSSNIAVFSVNNTGNSPLVITRVITTCGCTKVTWEKQPIATGQSTDIRVEMVPDETGFFNKTIMVYCNTNNSPMKLTVNGTTIE